MRIEDLADARVAAWRALATATTARATAQAFVVEGLRPAELLFSEKVYAPEALIVVADELLHRQRETQERAAALLRQASATGVPVFDVTREIFRKIADVSKIRGVMAVARRGEATLESLVRGLAEARGLAVAAVGLNDPGNVGTLMRSAYAFGAQSFFALEGSTDPFHPKVLRASAGHLLPAAPGAWKPFREACRTHGVRVLGLEAESPDACPLDELARDEARGTVVCIGSEGHGFPEGARDFDKRVRIPMRAGAESLNAGVAGSLVLWKLRKV
ncbi:MAG: RNA methyltransferase [Planctomycetota bacterium]|nr:RNA methyltransferase [Planctomycetota bacterium]